MTGHILRQGTDEHKVLRVCLSNPGKHNAISIAMWQDLRTLFEQLQAQEPEQAPRAVLLFGEGGHFAAGADIEEFPRFRFDEQALRAYHEETVAPALGAMLACDIPMVARIEGSCVGGGLEIAACCDIRIAAASSRFGIPIAKLGFPMAPGELLALGRVVPQATLRELLLEARLLDATAAQARGLVQHVVEPGRIVEEADATVHRIAGLSPNAARINKQTLRQIAEAALTPEQRRLHFGYADHPEHREGISAFLAKRPPKFL